EQVLRLYVSSGSLKLDWISIQAPQVYSDNNGKIEVSAVKYNQGTSHVIQYDNAAASNTGYTVAGTRFDYTLNVPESGQYLVTTNYATQQGGVFIDFVVNEKIVGSSALPATGS